MMNNSTDIVLSDPHAALARAAASPAPFGAAFMSTLGAGLGVFVVAGIPMMLVGGALFFVGWKAWSAMRDRWHEAGATAAAPTIEVRELPTVGKVDVGVAAARPRRVRVRKVAA